MSDQKAGESSPEQKILGTIGNISDPVVLDRIVKAVLKRFLAITRGAGSTARTKKVKKGKPQRSKTTKSTTQPSAGSSIRTAKGKKGRGVKAKKSKGKAPDQESRQSSDGAAAPAESTVEDDQLARLRTKMQTYKKRSQRFRKLLNGTMKVKGPQPHEERALVPPLEPERASKIQAKLDANEAAREGIRRQILELVDLKRRGPGAGAREEPKGPESKETSTPSSQEEGQRPETVAVTQPPQAAVEPPQPERVQEVPPGFPSGEEIGKTLRNLFVAEPDKKDDPTSSAPAPSEGAPAPDVPLSKAQRTEAHEARKSEEGAPPIGGGAGKTPGYAEFQQQLIKDDQTIVDRGSWLGDPVTLEKTTRKQSSTLKTMTRLVTNFVASDKDGRPNWTVPGHFRSWAKSVGQLIQKRIIELEKGLRDSQEEKSVRRAEIAFAGSGLREIWQTLMDMRLSPGMFENPKGQDYLRRTRVVSQVRLEMIGLIDRTRLGRARDESGLTNAELEEKYGPGFTIWNEFSMSPEETMRTFLDVTE